MALIEWSDRFQIGIASVDHEHREMIDLINRLHGDLNIDGASSSSNDDEVISFLGEIFSKISAHFALEEKEMRDLVYDQFEDHKTDHEDLLDEIRDIMDGYEIGTLTNYEGILAERLRSWFGEHFKTRDARLHKTIEGLL